MIYFRGNSADNPGMDNAGLSPTEQNGLEEIGDDTLCCGTCGYKITKTDFIYTVDGKQHYAFANPYGNAFRITCFSKAPGTIIIGGYTTSATWFAGYAWSYCICAGCHSHLGWHYLKGDDISLDSEGFFGLISDMLK